MTEPPRPPGEGNPNDPTAPFNPYAANDPTSGSTPPPPPPAPGGYAPPPAGGYGPPPAGGYAPPPGGGYQQQPPQQYGGYQPQGSNQPDDRTWILIAHLGGAAGAFLGAGVAGWIAPLIAMVARGNTSPVVRAEAIKALNFQLLWSIIGLVGWILACAVIGFFITGAAVIVGTVFGVIAGVKASNNEPYNYPMTVSIIK